VYGGIANTYRCIVCLVSISKLLMRGFNVLLFEVLWRRAGTIVEWY